LLLIGELAVQAGRHVAKLEPAERTRLLWLLGRARWHPGVLTEDERRELFELVARMEPQVFLAAAAARFSPIPIPRRLLEGAAHAAGRALRRRS
jgi:hypothetical protein